MLKTVFNRQHEAQFFENGQPEALLTSFRSAKQSAQDVGYNLFTKTAKQIWFQQIAVLEDFEEFFLCFKEKRVTFKFFKPLFRGFLCGHSPEEPLRGYLACLRASSQIDAGKASSARIELLWPKVSVTKNGYFRVTRNAKEIIGIKASDVSAVSYPPIGGVNFLLTRPQIDLLGEFLNSTQAVTQDRSNLSYYRGTKVGASFFRRVWCFVGCTIVGDQVRPDKYIKKYLPCNQEVFYGYGLGLVFLAQSWDIFFANLKNLSELQRTYVRAVIFDVLRQENHGLTPKQVQDQIGRASCRERV